MPPSPTRSLSRPRPPPARSPRSGAGRRRTAPARRRSRRCAARCPSARRRPRPRAVEVDDVQRPGRPARPSRARPRAGRRRRPSRPRSAPGGAARRARRRRRSRDRGSLRRHLGADAGEVREQAQAGLGRLLRVELHAVERRPVDHGHERARRTRSCPPRRRPGPAPARTSARGRRAWPRAGPRQRRRAREGDEVPADVRELAPAPPRAARRGRAGTRGRWRHRARPTRRTAAASPGTRPAWARPRPTCSRSSSSRPSSARLAIARGNAPTPGTTSPSAARMTSWSFVIVGAAPTRASAFSTERRLPIP